ncbi:transporter, major facilitator family protein [Prevotella sp. DNF00663]|uniref:MFS transporter n=1 Tax=Prevotella sp. DNF00663 TaxID=1384078 RepID=UPI0007833744|nr:MFS transporter [Prevotella sp. DNF00663]KXB84779.1 transporter, major facilitator family protein [Prevotella sp. DNF00663]
MKEKLWNGNYLKAMVANSMIYFAFYILTPLLPIFLSERFGATKDIIGIILSGYTIAALLTRPFSGFIVDSFSRKKVLVICFALFFVFFGGYIAASTLLMFAIIRTLHGGPFGAVTVANSTVAIDVLPSSRRNEGIGFYGLSNNLAMAIAPSVGIYIYKYLQDFTILFWIALFFALIGLWVASSIQVPTKQIVRRKRQLSLDRFFLIRGWLMAVNIAFFGFCFGVLSNYLAIYSKETMGITGGTGTYFAILSIGLFASRLQGAKALRRGLLTQNAAEGMLLSMVGYTLFAAFPNVIGYYGSAILIGLGNGHMYPGFLNMFIAVARHDERGTANSSILTSWDAGFGIGILLGGVVAEYLGYSATFWMVAIAQTSGVILFFTATKKFFEQHKREEE